MGNYSYIVDQIGCEITDMEKLGKICTENKIEHYEFALDKAKEEKIDLAKDIGNVLSGWKIQGYWYEDFVDFLYALAECMDLTDDQCDNQIEMEEEQGFKFCIYFYKEDNKPKVEIGYVPMEWIEETLTSLKLSR